jgi:hypothetical protein
MLGISIFVVLVLLFSVLPHIFLFRLQFFNFQFIDGLGSILEVDGRTLLVNLETDS